MKILAIDPGNIESGYVIVNEKYRPLMFGKVENEELCKIMIAELANIDGCYIEMIGYYGSKMNAGASVFDTCIWIGRFIEIIRRHKGVEPTLVKRAVIKTHTCGFASAKDGDVIRALKDRFGDKGTKSSPGFFYGFKADAWQAYALCAYALDMAKMKKD